MTPLESPGDRPAQRPKRTVFVVLPAYNEEARVGKLLDRIAETMEEAAVSYCVIVVDDGSRDATADLVLERKARMPIRLERHEANAGLGATLRDGLAAAAGLAADRDIIITMDADDTHTPGLILRMVRMISEGHDVVIASRYRSGSRTIGVPLSRRLLSRAASWLLRVLFPIRGVRDYTCGYRAYRAAVIKNAIGASGGRFLDQEGFQVMVDVLLKLRRSSLIFGEVPFILRYDLKEGGTKMKVGRTIVGTLLLVLKRKLGG